MSSVLLFTDGAASDCSPGSARLAIATSAFSSEAVITPDLDPTTHGFAIDDDPDRAFLAIYDYNDAGTVTIT